ncbi:MAG: formylglycine-generating enzyme family protein [Fibrobacter sp.]|nr:formylglycine-generating enzyme family protein [Fibrobacter sp.]
MMGSELGEPNETPVHKVELSDFYLDSTEVTQADFISLMEVKPWESNTGYIKGQAGPKQPVWYLNWYDAVLYCNARSKRDGLDTVYYYAEIAGSYGDSSVLSDFVIDYSKDGYRLPTEAEWEYACRAGTTTKYYWGNTYDVAGEFAWHRGISGLTTQVVAQKKPNGFGIHDMCGNVYEWVNDWRSTNYLTERLSPKGPVNDVIHNKITRGLSFYSNSNNMRSAYRGGCPVHERNSQTGFRVAKNK